MAPETEFLDTDSLRDFDARRFQQTRPYPWWNPKGVLRDDGWRRLCETLPTVEQMNPFFGVQRSHGQEPHDRYALEYHKDLPVAPEWHRFAAELKGPEYRDFLHRAFGTSNLLISYHWHYAPAGASVSPHCDAKRKLGSHIFYLNKEEEWDPAWGGQTLVLDDEGKFDTKSAPKFEDFAHSWTADATGNRSLLFRRQGNSWHGVLPLVCPPGKLRKVFIVVIESVALGLVHRATNLVKGKQAGNY